MTVKLLYHTPLWVASKAIRKCWASEDKSDTSNTNDDIGPKDRELIHRVGCKFKHESTLEHINYTFDIDGVSRALLQELSRHRHASLSVKSSRYTLKELKDIPYEDISTFLVTSGEVFIDDANIDTLSMLKDTLQAGTSNDIVKYMLPEAYKTSLVWTINLRALKNFFRLRTSKAALPEIRELAYEIAMQVPSSHQYLIEEDLI